MKQLMNNQRGAVALITTIIISILLGIILTGLIGTMSAEFRQQDDNEQASHAYFAAQSGVEDALGRIINRGVRTPQTTCLTLTFGSNNAKVTCELYYFSGTPTGNLSVPDKSTQVDTAGSRPYDRVVIDWSTRTGTHTCTVNTPAANWNCAAPLELQIVQYPNGAFNANDLRYQLKNAFFMPGGGNAPISYAGLSGSNPIIADCSMTGTYHCRATLTGFSPSDSYLFRLRSRYVGTDYQMTFYNGGSVVSVPDGTATIDVTAQSGDAYRRVLYKVPYEKGAASGLDYVIFSDNTISKTFCIFNNQLSGCSP